MHPYRDAVYRAERGVVSDSEELVLYRLLVVIGALPIVTALATKAVIGPESTMGLLMVAAGLIGWASNLRTRRWRRP